VGNLFLIIFFVGVYFSLGCCYCESLFLSGVFFICEDGFFLLRMPLVWLDKVHMVFYLYVILEVMQKILFATFFQDEVLC